MTFSAFRPAALAGLLLAGLLTGCQDHEPAPGPPVGQAIQSRNPKPAWGPTITPQMLAIVEELQRLNPTPLYTLTPQEARTKATVKDAVNSLLARNGIAAPQAAVRISQQMIPVSGGASVRAVVYTPTAPASGMRPVIVYFHGGGWVIANPEVYEATPMALAENTGAVVVSVEYRKAPENKFPTAHMDTYDAYKWVRQNASTLGGDPARIALAGESAGGNMAINVARMARDQNIGLPVHILSVYPVANNDLFTESYNKYADAMPLSRPLVQWFVDKYFNSPADGDSPQISLVDVADLSKLPPVTIIGAEIDPLQTEGRQLADKLRQQGVTVTYQLYTGVVHEFFGTYAIEPKALEAQKLAAEQLKQAFK